MIQTNCSAPGTAGLSYSLGTPTVDSYKSFAIAVSKVPGMGMIKYNCLLQNLNTFVWKMTIK